MSLSFDSIKRFIGRSLVKETFVYTATDAFGKAIGFLLLPIVSFYLPPEEMGIATNFSVLTTIVNLIAGQAIVNSLPYFFYEQNKEQNRQLVSNLFFICFTTCALLGVVAFFSSQIIESYLKLNTYVQVLAIFTVIANLVVNTGLILIRLENQAVSFAKFGVFQVLIHLLAVVLFVIGLRLGGVGKILAEAGVAIFMAFLHMGAMIRKGYIHISLNYPTIKRLLKFGIPLLPHSLSFWFKGGMDKVFITTYCGLAMNGIFSMALTVTSLYTIVTHAFFNAYTPYLQKKLSTMTTETEKEVKYKVVKMSYLLIGCFFLMALLAIFAGWLILNYVVDEKYKESFRFLPGLILGLYIYAIYSFSIQFVYKKKKTFALGCITFTGSLIQMGFSFMFIKNFGAIGAVYSSVLGTFIISVSVFILSYVVYPMPWFSFIRRNDKV